jgi:hypothetical protein
LPRFIDRAVSSYLKGQLESGGATQTKKALQEICKLYRTGYRLIPDQLIGIENGIIGLTFSSDDAKVRRWSLNALAQLGREDACKHAILHATQTYHDDPDVLAAAIAALYRLCPTAAQELRRLGFDEKMLALAALQHVPADRLDLSSLPLNIEHASDELVKLGLVVVGLNKAPPNMFDPDYDNQEIVRVLGGHHSPIVSQYSVWAITENPNLGVADLGVDLKSIEQRPPNVRAWVFQLLAMDAANIERHIEYIKLGMADKSVTARIGLAIGLRDSFSTTLAPLVLEWFTRELIPEVRQHIVDHLIRQADNFGAYREYVVDAFERANPGSPERERMLATASGTPIFQALTLIHHDAGMDLLRGAKIVNNDNRTINIGSVQAGAVAIDGDATNTGTTSIYNSQTLEVIRSRLLDAEQEIKKSVADDEAKREALEAIAAAKANPTKDNVSKAITTMEKVEALAYRTLGAATALAGIAQLLAQAAGFH